MPSIWDYFNRRISTAVCNNCNKELSLGHDTPKKQTCSNIKQHLRKQHPADWLEFTGGRGVAPQERKIIKPKKAKMEIITKQDFDEAEFPKVFVTELTESEGGRDDDDHSLDILLPRSSLKPVNSEDTIQHEIVTVLRDISDEIREQRKNLMETDQELIICEKKRIRLMEEYVKCYKKQTEAFNEYLKRK